MAQVDTTQRAQGRKPGRFRRWRRAILALLLLVSFSVYFGYRYLTDPQRISALAADTIAEMLGARVTVGNASFGLDGQLTLWDVDLRVPDVAEGANRLFSAEAVLIEHDMPSLLRGTFKPTRVVVSKPMMYVTEDLSGGRFQFQMLRPPPPKPDAPPLTLPAISLEQGKVIFGEVDAQGKYRITGTTVAEGSVLARAGEQRAYNFNLNQRGKDDRLGPILRGGFDLSSGAAHATLENFDTHSVQRYMLPSDLRQWYDQMNAQGSAPTAKLDYDPQRGVRARIDVKDVALTLPWVDCRLEEVAGWFEIDKIVKLSLKGKLHDERERDYSAQYEIKGEMQGFDPQAPFAVHVTVAEAEIPKEPATLHLFPEAVAEIFADYQPRGQFAGAVTIGRFAHGDPIAYNGKLTLINVAGLYENFRYPLHKLAGTILIDSDGVRMHNITGEGPTGARMTLNGYVNQPNRHGSVRIEVQASGPLDDYLRAALEPDHVAAIDSFIDREQYQRLVKLGVIMPSEQHAAYEKQLEETSKEFEPHKTQLRNPHPIAFNLAKRIEELSEKVAALPFDLSTMGSAKVVVTRDEGEHGQWHTYVEVPLSGLSVLYRYWPYPLQLARGRVIVENDILRFEDVTVKGLTGGGGSLRGQIAPPDEDGGTPIPDIIIEAKGLPGDKLLLATIDPPQDQWLRALRLVQSASPDGLKGAVDFEGRVFRNEQKQIDYHIDATLRDMQARPNRGGYRLDEVNAQFTIFPGKVAIHHAQARHGDSELIASATWDRTGAQARFDLKLTAEKLRFEDPVLDLVPTDASIKDDDLRALLAAHSPEGTLDADLVYSQIGDDVPTYQLQARPADLSFTLRDKRIVLTELTGVVELQPGTITLRRIDGAFGDEEQQLGTFAVNGVIHTTGDHRTELMIDAQADAIDPVTRHVLLPDVVNAFDSLRLSSGYRVEGATLVTRDDAERGTAIDFQGKVQLTDATAQIGIAVTELVGVIDMAVQHRGSDPWPTMNLVLNAEQARLEKRLIAPLSLRLVTGDRPEVLLLHEFKGLCYGGVLTGAGEIRLGERVGYTIDLRLEDAAKDKFVQPDAGAPAARSERALKARQSATSQTAIAADTPPTADQAPSPAHASDAAAGPTTQSETLFVAPNATLTASLQLEGVAGESQSKLGRGKLRIRDARLYDLPIVLAILERLHLGSGSKYFDRADVDYIIEGDDIRLDRVVIQGTSIEIFGDGVMDFQTGAIDLLLYLRNPAAADLGAVTQLFNMVKDTLISFHVTGTLESPKANVISFQGVQSSWHEVFGQRR